MKDRFIKGFMSLNRWLLRLSRGRLGGKLGTQTVLLLHTVGRKSGREHVIPIAYFDFDGKVLIVASNWGRDRQADWYLNLKKNPQAEVDIKGQHIRMVAREVQGEEYERLWQYATERHPPYLNYQQMTTRRIPIMIFERED